MQRWTALACALSVVASCAIASVSRPAAPARAQPQSTPQAMQPTTVNVIQPSGTTGADFPQTATCSSGSATLTRPGVWRCNTIDPCFSLPDVTTYVICNVDLATGLGRKLNLSQPLDPSMGWQNAEPSAQRLDLDNGLTCTFVAGATFAFQNQRANYQCSESLWIVGQPQPGLIWTVTVGTLVMTPMPEIDPNSIATVAVRVAWV